MFFQVNVRTAMSVGQASGLALAEAAIAGCEVVQYTPNQVKDAVAGWGGADKIQVQKMVQVRLGLTSLPKPADAADAAALALCHLAMSPHLRSGRCEAHDRFAARLGARTQPRLHGAARGRRCRVPRHRVDTGPGRTRTVENTRSSTSTTTSARTTRRCTGSRRARNASTFQVLIGAHGIGPALAMAILATHPPAALVDIVASNDTAALSLVPGVGKKTAERLIVELRDRLSIPVLENAGATRSASAVADVREALTGLGYGTDEVRDVLRDLSGDTDSASLLREALKSLGARRA